MEKTKLEEVIFFEADSDEITPAARTILEDIARYLAQPEQENVNRLELEVGSENVGSKVYNDNLSINRSIAAQRILKQELNLFRRKGIDMKTLIGKPSIENCQVQFCSSIIPLYQDSFENLVKKYKEIIRTLIDGDDYNTPETDIDNLFNELCKIVWLKELDTTNLCNHLEAIFEALYKFLGVQYDDLEEENKMRWRAVRNAINCSGKFNGEMDKLQHFFAGAGISANYSETVGWGAGVLKEVYDEVESIWEGIFNFVAPGNTGFDLNDLQWTSAGAAFADVLISCTADEEQCKKLLNSFAYGTSDVSIVYRPLTGSFEYSDISARVEEMKETLRLHMESPYHLGNNSVVDFQIQLSKKIILPWEQFQNIEDYSSNEWMIIRENQKKLWRKRLLVRIGHPPSINPPELLEITDENWQNLFLIEALVEFYMNYTNPWGAGEVVGETVPRLPTMDGYISVDLSSDWHLVLIDPCDGRLSGSELTAASNSNDIVLEGINVDTDKINPGFDTIYLEAARPKKIFRIETVTSPNIITLDESPNFDYGVGAGIISSNWHIPAGFSRQLTGMNLDCNPGPGGEQGWDQYNGMMLIIKDGAVHAKYPWSSYTSRAATGIYRASLQGNNSYKFISWRAGHKSSINYAFRIPTEYSGEPEESEASENPEESEEPPAQVPTYFYFDPENENSSQSSGIMIHFGSCYLNNSGSGSTGCLVSPEFYDFRDKMIELYQEDYEEINGQIDQDVDELDGLTRQQSIALYNNNGVTANQWNEKITGVLWLARPEQPPISGEE